MLGASAAFSQDDGGADQVRDAQRLRHATGIGEPRERLGGVVDGNAGSLKDESTALVNRSGALEELVALGCVGKLRNRVSHCGNVGNPAHDCNAGALAGRGDVRQVDEVETGVCAHHASKRNGCSGPALEGAVVEADDAESSRRWW